MTIIRVKVMWKLFNAAGISALITRRMIRRLARPYKGAVPIRLCKICDPIAAKVLTDEQPIVAGVRRALLNGCVVSGHDGSCGVFVGPAQQIDWVGHGAARCEMTLVKVRGKRFACERQVCTICKADDSSGCRGANEQPGKHVCCSCDVVAMCAILCGVGELASDSRRERKRETGCGHAKYVIKHL